MNIWQSRLVPDEPDWELRFNLDWPPSKQDMIAAVISGLEMGFGVETWKTRKAS